MRGGDGSQKTRVGRSLYASILGESIVRCAVCFNPVVWSLDWLPPPNLVGFGLCSLSWCVVSTSFVSQLYPILLILFVSTIIINNLINYFLLPSGPMYFAFLYFCGSKVLLHFHLVFSFKWKLHISKMAQAVDPAFFPPPPSKEPKSYRNCQG